MCAFETDLLPIDTVGDVIHQQLLDHDKLSMHGRIHSVFRRCAYLQFNRILVCAALPELGNSSITLLLANSCQTLPACFTPGAKVSLSMNDLRISDRFVFCARNAGTYDSVIVPRRVDLHLMNVVNQRVQQLDLPHEGLAPVLKHDGAHRTGESALLQYAKPLIDELLEGLPVLRDGVAKVYDYTDSPRWVRLMGAGPGLTPSGDDFLIGVLVALHLLGQKESAQVLWGSVAVEAKTSTTQISNTLLEQAACGRVSQTVRLFIDTLFADDPTTTAGLNSLLRQMGETSGWDWLAGFVLTLNVLLQHSSVTPLARVH